MTANLRSRRLSIVVFLILLGAPLCAEAQQFVCSPIVRGDTASRLALRLTGTSAAAYGEAFQIRDPTRQKFVPKSQYARLSTDWQACVLREPARRSVPAAAPATETSATSSAATSVAPAAAAWAGLLSEAWAGLLAAAGSAPLAVTQYDVAFAVTFGAGVSLMLLMISAVSSYTAGRPMPPALQRAGEDFLTAFATPLVDPTSAVPPVTGYLRFVRRKKRLEICIAPNGGRRYPNLSDHRENVVYDVQRVVRIIGGHRIVCDRLHAEGQWVVVSIRLAEPKQAGAK
jgi:hypothetical protein